MTITNLRDAAVDRRQANEDADLRRDLGQELIALNARKDQLSEMLATVERQRRLITRVIGRLRG